MTFSVCKKMAAVILGAVLFGLLPINVYAKDCEPFIQCTKYVQEHGFSDITVGKDNGAKLFWTVADSKGYSKGFVPAVDAVLVWDGWDTNQYGHVAIVANKISSTEITIKHSNWGNDGCEDLSDNVRDVSVKNDWTLVKVNNGATDYKTFGFIYPKGYSPVVEAACKLRYCWYPKEASCEQANKWYILPEQPVVTANQPYGTEMGSNMCTDMNNYLNFIAQAPDCRNNVPEDVFSQAWWRSVIHSFFDIKTACGAPAIQNSKVYRTINIATNAVVAGNGMVLGDSTGSGYSTPATDPIISARPDYVAKSVKLYNAGGVETYQYLVSDPITMVGTFANIGHADCPSDKKVEVHFYRSNGYKEDAHSDWQRVSTNQIRCDNINPKDAPKNETAVLNPGLAPGFYNIVACIDHIQNDHNNGGAYPEEHESNNCSTEAVFQIVLPPVQCQSPAVNNPLDNQQCILPPPSYCQPPLINDPANNQQCINPPPAQCQSPLINDPADNQKCITPPPSPAQISAVLEVINTLLLDDEPCVYTLAPATKATTTAGGAFTATTTTAAECGWKLSSNKTWLTFTSAATGKGNNTLNYSVAANPTYAARAGVITLTSATDATVKKTLTVRQAAKLGISIAQTSVTEGAAGAAKEMVFTVKLNQAATKTVNVNYSTAKATAVAGADYTATSGTLSFLAGQTVKTVSVPIIGDAVVEPNETFWLLLSAPTAPYALQFSRAAGTILNDD
jgi:surface antigen